MIIDAFTFFNEKELVELRVKYLNDIVDCFLIVEADFTHTGKEKKRNFPEILNNSLKEFSENIVEISFAFLLNIVSMDLTSAPTLEFKITFLGEFTVIIGSKIESIG